MPHLQQQPFTSRFISAVLQFPTRSAMSAGSDVYSYAEMLSYVTGIMEVIGDQIPGEDCVAVADHNDVYTYASFIALNLLGKTYVPVNPSNPEKYNQQIIQQTEIRTILSSAAFQCGETRVLSNRIEPVSNDQKLRDAVSASSRPAYILFTSGSTGKPKGVPVGNHQLNAFFDFFSEKARFDFGPDDRFLQVYETTFDVSVFSAFMPLFSGACMYLLPKKNFVYLEIPQMLADKEITVLSMVPSVLHYLHPYFSRMKFEKLRYSFFSGDRLFQRLTEAWSTCIPNAEIINCYGPTETTIVCTYYPWRKNKSAEESLNGVVPIGKAFSGMDYILVDNELNEVSPGASGELCFSGTQVIDRYLQEEFKENFFDIAFHGRRRKFYRTGDRVQVNRDGNLLFIGRVDSQLKINGYRVEPAEIESVLSKLSGNKQAAVIAWQGKEGFSSLCAFLEGEGDEHEVLGEMKKHLPLQSIPRKIVFLEKMPMNGNGKIDRQELLRFV